uniref:Uncharacterized protein n=1 Tax=Anopheles marajoara TaxID=58244 RepID=A0A2M4CDG9_9DIPT
MLLMSPLPVPLLVECTPPEALGHPAVHCDCGGTGGHDASRPVASAVADDGLEDDGDDGDNHGRWPPPYVMMPW